MAVLVLVELAGDPDRLIAGVKEHLEPVMNRIAAENGARWHSLARGDGGIMIVDVWVDAESVQRTLAMPEVQEAIGKAGLPEPRIEFRELVDYGDI